MAKPKKEIQNIIKLVIPAGKANPAPPLGPILGQNGIPMGPFTQEFNEKTAQLGNVEIPVVVTVFKDRSFEMQIKQPTIASMLKEKFKIQKGSGVPNKEKVGSVNRKDLYDIAERKIPDLNTTNVESAVNTVAGVANSMGLEVKE